MKVDHVAFIDFLQKLVTEIHRQAVIDPDNRIGIIEKIGILSDLLGCIKPSEDTTEIPSGIELFGDLFKWNTHPPTPAEPGNCDYVTQAGQTSAGTVFKTDVEEYIDLLRSVLNHTTQDIK